MTFCPQNTMNPASCPMSLGTIIFEMIFIFIALTMLIVLTKYLKHNKFELVTFPVTAIVLLFIGSTFSLINAYYWYQFHSYRDQTHGEIILKAIS